MAKDPTYVKLIHTARWLKLRREVLMEHPECQRCLQRGIHTFATEVHHVTPCEYAVGQDAMRQLMFDRHNLMALCHSCHVEVHNEMGRSGKEASRRINKSRFDSLVEKFYGN